MEDNTKKYEELIATKKALWEEITKDDDGWEKPELKDGVVINKRPYKDTGLKFVRAKATIKASPKDVFELIKDTTKTMEYDKNIEKLVKLDSVGDYDFVYTIAKKPAMMIERRDSVVCSKVFDLGDGKILLLGGSIEHADYPPTSAPVRCNIELWAWHLVPDEADPESCVATYIIFVDPKGWIPTQVTNSVSNEQAMNVKRIKDYLEGV